MADNVTFQTTTATPPSGTVVSTEEVSTLNGGAVTAQQVQRVIPAIRTGDGVAVDVPGDSSNGIDVDVTRVSGTVAVSAVALPLPSGAATSALQSSQSTLIGAVDETAPATDTASSGLNGRLQRIAQRLTSLIALLPTSLGQKTKANSLAVTLASDQDALPVTDNSGSLTVDNAGTFAVQAAQSGAWNITDISGTVSLPTGAATAARQDTQTTALQLIDDVIKTDDAAFTPATDKVAMIGAEFDDTTPDSVDEGDAGALRMSANRNLYTTLRDAAGNERGANVNASGQLETSAAQSGTWNITNVSGTVSLPTGASTAANQATANGLLTTIDADTGTLAGAVAGTEMQVDVVGALPAGTNNIGDVDIASIAAGDNNIGNVDIVTMPNVTLAAGTNTNEVVGDVAQDAPVAGNPLLMGGRASAAAPSDMSTDGDAVHLWTTLKGALNVADAGGSLTVDGTVTANLAAGTNNIGDVDILSIAAGDNNIGNVDIVTMPGVAGTVADDGTTPGNPVMIGGKAVETDGTDPTSVSAEDDVAILRTDRNRRLLVNTAHPNQWVARENHTTAGTNNELKAAPGANLSLYITDIIMSTDTATNIKLVRDTAGTPADIAGPFYFAANGGIAMPLVTPIRVTANQNVGFTGGTTGNFTVEIHGYTAP